MSSSSRPALELTLIVAATLTNGIGANGTLPWRLPKEMAYFAQVTMNAPERATNAVVMGRKSWESIPERFRPLRNRFNVVVSGQAGYDLGKSASSLAILRPSLPTALDALNEHPLQQNGTSPHRTFVIGGASLYSEAFNLPKTPSGPYVNRILLTRILSPAFDHCNVFFPELDTTVWHRASHDELVAWTGIDVPKGPQEERAVTYEFQMWIR